MSSVQDPVPLQPQHGASGGEFRRDMGLLSTLSLGFTYLSPLAAICALMPFALVTGGPSAIWWIAIAAVGQLLVALVFGEVVSQYPISGGLYPWSRRLWGRKYAWLAAWIYLAALIVTITSVAQFGVVFVTSFFGIEWSTTVNLVVAVALIVAGFVINIAGTRTLGTVVKVGFFAEIAGVIVYGVYLLVFERHNSPSVFFDSLGAGGDASYFSTFLLAGLTGLFLFYGFEACGDVAEEVSDPARQIPKAMYLTIVVGGGSAALGFIGFILAAPDLQSIVDGEVADPVSAILDATVGTVGTKVFLGIAITVFVACILSLQAALSRLIFSFSRDDMLPGSRWLKVVDQRSQVPRNALILCCVLPSVLCLWVYFQADSLTRITSFAVIAIYVAFQMVVLAALRQRLKGWRPAGPWNLGAAGFAVNVAALVYGVLAIILLARPGDASLGFVDRYVVLLGLGVVLVAGLVFMVLAKPYENSEGPEGDAVEVAARLRSSHRS